LHSTPSVIHPTPSSARRDSRSLASGREESVSASTIFPRTTRVSTLSTSSRQCHSDVFTLCTYLNGIGESTRNPQMLALRVILATTHPIPRPNDAHTDAALPTVRAPPITHHRSYRTRNEHSFSRYGHAPHYTSSLMEYTLHQSAESGSAQSP
jgi:hypothetical protein